MASPIKPERAESWLNKHQMAAALDVRPSYFDRAIRPHAKPEHVRRVGKQMFFYARGVLDAWYASKRANSPAVAGDEVASEDIWLYIRTHECGNF